MAKLPRVFQNLFGLNGSQSHFGQFGSRAASAPLPTKDPSTIQSLDAFVNNGWLDAINAANKAPFLEDMNGLFLLIFRQIGYFFQEGIPEWDTSTTYYIGSIVKKTGTFELYGSLTNTNVGNALPSQVDSANWKYLNPPPLPPGSLLDHAGQNGGGPPVGYLYCDGTQYAQASYPALYAAIGDLWATFNGWAAPGAGNFRVPDLRSVTTIGNGQGIGLSLRSVGQFVGEETHTLVVGEMPSHTHSVNDPGHAHTEKVGVGGGSLTAAVSSTLTSAVTNTSFATVAASTGITLDNTGGGGAHNNMQPSAGVYKMIKY